MLRARNECAQFTAIITIEYLGKLKLRHMKRKKKLNEAKCHREIFILHWQETTKDYSATKRIPCGYLHMYMLTRSEASLPAFTPFQNEAASF